MDGELPCGAVTPAVFARASASDDREIRGLLRDTPMSGEWKIGFLREPSYFACPAPAGIAENSLVARRNGRVISVGAWSVRDAWLCGEPARVGYLQGLRMAAGTPGSMRVLRDGYAALAGQIAGVSADAWFTSVDAENMRARRIFESRASGLPRYRRMAEYRTRILPVRMRGGSVVVHHPESREELTDFLQREGARHELALTWNAARWRDLDLCGFSPGDVTVARSGGRIVAAAGVWDQQRWKQLVVHEYPDALRRIQPVANRIACCLGWPQLPAMGRVVPLAPIFPFAVEEGHENVIPDLWRGVEQIARSQGVEWLALGLDATDPLWMSGVMPRIGIDYRTLLYQVSGMGIPESSCFPSHGKYRPECATL